MSGERMADSGIGRKGEYRRLPDGRGMKKILGKMVFIPLFSLILRPQVWEFPLVAGTLTPKSK
jgi:hypothetical protein